MCKKAKSVVSKGKLKKYDGLNEKLRAKENEKEVYRLMNVRQKQFKGLKCMVF